MTHNAKLCMERPRKIGAKWTNNHIAPDEKIETFELDYDAGIEAAEAATNIIIADTPTATEEKRFATWGTDVPDDMALDQKKLAEALKKSHVFSV
ncbi:pre-mRNA-splicing factor slu7-like protein [Trifolium pratense]|uniref:Pre-mRNA-splicing factor SLU7 n=1 Tax=Trifolium pratense TaxID=57577 RepID=A0A2K3PQ08_TRIPR|nr:pre-mRNA-splicing factor slu7-like protein [Trifolium pratense]